MHQLTSPSMLDPRWFNQMRSGKWHEAQVVDSQSIHVEGQVLSLAFPTEIALVSSQKVYVVLTNHFYLETEKEQQERIQKLSERIDQEREAIERYENRNKSAK